MTTSCVAVPTKKEGSQEIIIQRLEQASTHKNGQHPDHCFKQIKLCASNLVSKFFKSDVRIMALRTPHVYLYDLFGEPSKLSKKLKNLGIILCHYLCSLF